MSVRPLSIFVCEKVLRDILDPNKLSFIGVFSGFSGSALPFMCPPMFLAAQYGLGQGEFIHHFEIQHSSGQVIFKSPEHEFFLDNRTVYHTDIAGVEGIVFSNPGQYWIRSFLNGEQKAEVPLNVTYKPPEYKPSGEEGVN